MNVSMRRLARKNVAELRELNKLFADVFEDPKNYEAQKPSDNYLSAFLNDENHIVLVAERDGHVIGGLVAYCLTKFERERKEVYLYDLAVSADLQRLGVGRMLVNELRRMAKSLGASVVFVQADEADEAVAFYESLDPIENIKARSFDFDTK